MNEIFKLLNKYNSNSFKKLGNNPTALTKFNYISEVLPNIDEYYVTDKADGQRAFLIVKENSAKYVIAAGEIELNPDIIFARGTITLGIFDCELIDSKLYIFDVLEYNGENVSRRPFEERIKIFSKLDALNSKKISIKTYRRLTTAAYQKEILAAFREKRPYKVDGLIFTQRGRDYNTTRNLKWKPPEQLTIDFLYIADANINLFVGMDKRSWMKYGFPFPQNYEKLISAFSDDIVKNGLIQPDYFPVAFDTSLGSFSKFSVNSIGGGAGTGTGTGSRSIKSGSIIELSWDKDKNTWIFHRIRTDREVELKTGHYYGNNYKVAEQTLQAALNPLKFKDLIESYGLLTTDFYFQKRDDSYKAVRKFNNYVKDVLIKRYTSGENKKIVMDLASGKGQDLQKYVNAGVKELLMIEIDINAIDEILNRKYDILGKIYVDKHELDKPINVQNKSKFILNILHMDLNKKWKDNVKIINFSPGVIFCNLALHYMLNDAEHINNICAFISHFLEQKDKEFIFTALDGLVVTELIKTKSFIVKDNNGADKYMIEKSGSKKIKVKLPCSDKPYEEPLINLFELDKVFKKHNIFRVEHEQFGKLLNEFKQYRSHFYNELDENDIKFIGLYSYTVYKKILK